MKAKIFLPILSCSLLALACQHQKKTVAPKQESTPASVVTSPVIGPSVSSTPANGVYTPTEREHAAIQTQYPNTSLEMLKQGYVIYTGACTNCHEAKSVYQYTDSDWGSIMTDMAMRARLTDSEKEAVWKFVMAARATNPNKK